MPPFGIAPAGSLNDFLLEKHDAKIPSFFGVRPPFTIGHPINKFPPCPSSVRSSLFPYASGWPAGTPGHWKAEMNGNDAFRGLMRTMFVHEMAIRSGGGRGL